MVHQGQRPFWKAFTRLKSPVDQKASQPQHTMIQNHLSNRAIQRLLVQRTGGGPTELDDDTADRINRARGGGQTLDTTIQQKMGEAMDSDFSGVNVHTGNDAHELNDQLGARAFTTGQDIFFRSGEYNPQSSGGQELLAHELTHVVQQSSGAVPGGGKMAVNVPGDRFEQEADAVAKEITSGPSQTAASGVQRQELPEEEEVQTKRLQREEATEDEENLV